MKKWLLVVMLLAVSVAHAQDKKKEVKENDKPQLVIVESDGTIRPLKKEDGLKCVVLTVWGGIHCVPVKK